MRERAVVLVTRHDAEWVVETLNREIDQPPSLLRGVLTLNAHYYVGRSPVCGRVREGAFELRNRKGPAFSLRAVGTLTRVEGGGTQIALSFSKPLIPDMLGVLVFRRYRWGRETIVSFLKQHLHAIEGES